MTFYLGLMGTTHLILLGVSGKEEVTLRIFSPRLVREITTAIEEAMARRG